MPFQSRKVHNKCIGPREKMSFFQLLLCDTTAAISLMVIFLDFFSFRGRNALYEGSFSYFQDQMTLFLLLEFRIK